MAIGRQSSAAAQEASGGADGGRALSFTRNRKAREAEAAAAAEYLRLFHNYEDMGLGWFWATDVDGRITYISDTVSNALGEERHRLLGRELVSLFRHDSENVERRRTLPFQLMRQGRFEMIPVRVDAVGEEQWWALSGQPQQDAKGNFCGYLGHGVDITARQKSAEESARLAL